MDLTHAKSTKELLDFQPKAKSVSHFFERKANEDSFYFCSIFRCTEDVGILVTRYGDQDLYRYFLKKTKTQEAFETLLALVEGFTWSELVADREKLLDKHRIVFETLPIKMSVVHSLDFFDTVEVNAEPIFMDRKILDGYERVRRNGLVQKGVGSYKV